MDTEVGWMSPFTSLASMAYGTLATSARGLISDSPSMVTPRYRVEPSNVAVSNGVAAPSCTEKYPSSKVIACVSVQIGATAASAS
jgi:hypothetical protein